MPTLVRWRLSWWIAFAVLMGLADALLVSWRLGNGWMMAVFAMAIAAVIAWAAWSLRRSRQSIHG